MSEQEFFYILVAGAVIVLAGYFWLIARGFRTRIWWGLGLLLFFPLALLFIPKHFRRSLGPFLVMVLGGAVLAMHYAVNYFLRHHVDLGPYADTVHGELHLTLTGWDQSDYSFLREQPEVVVLQMANADVNDETLQHLSGLKRLRELDLNRTKVSDLGLVVLQELPELRTLRLRDTQVTDAGFREHLMSKDSLMELELRGTQVKPATMREWRRAKEGRKSFP